MSLPKTPDIQRLIERITGLQRITLGDAFRLRDLGIAPFEGSTVFVLGAGDGVELAGCTKATREVELASVLADLHTRAHGPAHRPRSSI